LKTIILLFIVGYLYPVCSFAAPSISLLTGTYKDGESIIISGSSFGANALDIEWLGGSSGNIEQGALGNAFSCTGWTADTTAGDFTAPSYSNTRYHSGSKSILSQYPDENDHTSGFSFDYGSEFGTTYATWWTYFDHVDSKGQWRKWHLNPDNSANTVDGEIQRNDFYLANGTVEQALLMLFCDVESYGQCYPGSNAGLRWTTAQPVDAWVRTEVYAVESSAVDTRDGTLILNQQEEGELVTNLAAWSGTIITRVAGASRWRYWKFRNSWVNISGGDGTQERIYTDDIYIQVGTQSRVEIGNNATFANCTHREIQYPTAWATDSITFTLNQGSFGNTDTVYVFVVDADGAASSGYEITLNTTTGSASGFIGTGPAFQFSGAALQIQ